MRLTDDHVRFLNEQRVAHLATVDDAGVPSIVPICFACAGGALYTAIDEKPKRVSPGELRRVRNILEHPDVCVIADRYDEDWSLLAWLQLHGRASIVSDADERSTAFSALRERYPQYRAMDLESRPLIRVTPERIVVWRAALSTD